MMDPARRHGERRYTRQRTGCLTCRQRKKRCNQAYPVCGHCSRLNLLCRWEEPRMAAGAHEQLDPAGEHAKHQQASECVKCQRDQTALLQPLTLQALESELDCHPSASGVDLLSSRRAMMRYYTASFALMLTTNVENNCFLSALLPMAFDCPPLICALAAFASTHLALRDPKFRQVSLTHRGVALGELGKSVSQGTLSEECFLAVTMVMCSMDSISEATDTWLHHLSGAAACAQKTITLSNGNVQPCNQASSLMKSFEGRWLLRNFAYHDILMSVSMSRRPFIRGDYWTAYPEGAGHGLADTYFGFAAQVLYIVGEISHLRADIQSEGSMWDSSISHRAERLEHSLWHWANPASSADAKEPLALLGEAYRHAALIHLYRTIRNVEDVVASYTGTLRSKLQASITAVCEAARAMPLGSLAECTMLFPLFMAGGEASREEDIEAVRERLASMNQWRRFRNVDICMDVLDEVWRLESAGTRRCDSAKVDWADVAESKGWKLALS